MDIISGNDLKIGYNNILCEIPDFSIQDGEFVCVTGPNGAGKSTFIKTLLGLNPLKGGSLNIDASVNFGYLPQYSSLKDFPASVEEIVLSGRLKNKLCYKYSKEDKEKAKHCMMLMDLTDLSKKLFNNLSGGQRQRVLLARALCSDCNVLVLDEPTNNLDESSRKQLYERLDFLNNESSKTIIMITHESKLDFVRKDKLKVIRL